MGRRADGADSTLLSQAARLPRGDSPRGDDSPVPRGNVGNQASTRCLDGPDGPSSTVTGCGSLIHREATARQRPGGQARGPQSHDDPRWQANVMLPGTPTRVSERAPRGIQPAVDDWRRGHLIEGRVGGFESYVPVLWDGAAITGFARGRRHAPAPCGKMEGLISAARRGGVGPEGLKAPACDPRASARTF